jgi:hypothetical protein
LPLSICFVCCGFLCVDCTVDAMWLGRLAYL